MKDQCKKLIKKYGPDLFLFVRQSSLNGMIWDYPAFSDADWASILKSSSAATRVRILSNLPETRRNSLSGLIETGIQASEEEIVNLLMKAFEYYGCESCFFPENSNDDFAPLYSPAQDQKFIWAEEPFDLFTAVPDETIARWLLITNAARENPGAVFEALLGSSIDDYTRNILVRAIQWPNSAEFAVQDLRESFLNEVTNSLEGMSEIARGICKGKSAEDLKGTIASRFCLEPAGLDLGRIVPGSITEGPQSVESISSMLGLADKAIQDGILSIEEYFSEIPSVFFREGLDVVTSGFEPEYLDMWLKARKRLFIQDAERSFDVIETGCRIILNGCWSGMGRTVLQAHTFMELPSTRDTGLLPQSTDKKKSSENNQEDLLPVSGQLKDTGTNISTPFGWFVFRLCLDEIKSDHPDILKNLSAIAELAAAIPPDRWKMIESEFPLSGRDRIQAFQLGIESIKPDCIQSPGRHALNLIRNMQPDFDALPDSYADYRDMFQQLTDLKYWDALLLEQEDFSRLITCLSPQEVAGLSSSSWGRFAIDLGMPLDNDEKYDCSWDQARSGLLAALADIALQSADFKIPVSAGHDENDSVIEILDRMVKKYADGFVEGTLHLTTDDLLFYGQIIAGLSSMETGAGVAAFNCFHDNIIFDLLYGLEPYTDDFELICGLLPQLDQEKRNALRQRISRSDCKTAATFAKALSFGFEQMTELSDVQLRELLKYVSNEDLCLALINGSTDLIEKFMSNMSERAGNMIREDMEIGLHSFSRERVLRAKQRLVNLVMEYGLLPAEGGIQRESNKSIVRRIISNLYQSEGEDDLF